jgi:protein gp37
MTRRLQGMGLKKYSNGFKLTLHPELLDEPKKISDPSMFFVCSMSDIFHDNVPDWFVDEIMNVIKDTPQHTYQILTKRTTRMFEYFNTKDTIPSNIWLGTTVEHNDYIRRIGVMRSINHSGIKFLSCEPLIGDLGTLDLHGIDWVIVGGESGSQARPIHKEWVLNIQRQCKKQAVPFFFKQWGTWGEDGIKRNKKSNGCTIDGKIYQEWPKSWNGGAK